MGGEALLKYLTTRMYLSHHKSKVIFYANNDDTLKADDCCSVVQLQAVTYFLEV